MKPIEIVQAMRAASPDAFGTMKDQRVAGIVNSVFQHLAGVLKDAPEGPLRIPGLGVFVVRHVEVEKDGVKTPTRRVMYRAPGAGKKVQQGEVSAAPAPAAQP